MSVLLRAETSDGSHVLRLLALSQVHTLAPLVLGAALVLSSLCGAVAFFHGLQRPSGSLKWLSILLILLILYTMATGSTVWFITLQERQNFWSTWQKLDRATVERVQQQLSCCGYWNATSAVKGFVLDNVPDSCLLLPTKARSSPCVDPLCAWADNFLNRIFTLIYALTAVEVSTLLATLCLDRSRRDQARLKNLDAKWQTARFSVD
ncbi:hypothetical protein ACM66B_002232 [Microbotryomycetes sp. NB124-2]